MKSVFKEKPLCPYCGATDDILRCGLVCTDIRANMKPQFMRCTACGETIVITLSIGGKGKLYCTEKGDDYDLGT